VKPISAISARDTQILDAPDKVPDGRERVGEQPYRATRGSRRLPCVAAGPRPVGPSPWW
jgi:hypothetical protein